MYHGIRGTQNVAGNKEKGACAYRHRDDEPGKESTAYCPFNDIQARRMG